MINMTRKFWAAATLVVTLCIATAGYAHQHNRNSSLVIIGTAGLGSVYYPSGVELCRVLNQTIMTSGIRCLVLQSGGAIYNILAVGKGRLQMAITTDDMLEDAYLGQGVFDAPMTNLRMVMPLYENPFSIIVPKDSPINSFEDLIGKRVNIGGRGAGRHVFGKFLFRLKGLADDDFQELTAFGSAQLKPALCRGDTDAILQLVGYPSHFYETLHEHCPVKIISLDDATIETLLTSRPLLSRVVLEYPDSDGNLQTWNTVSTKAVLFTTTDNLTTRSVNDILRQLHANIAQIHDNTTIAYPVPKIGDTPHTAVPLYTLLDTQN